MNSLFANLADLLENDWHAMARPEQLPPPGDWSIWLILAGRGWGKTRTGAEWTRSIAETGKVSHIALVGPTAADVRDVMVEGPSGLLAIAPNSNRPLYEPSKRRLRWENGVTATMFSSEEPERLRGPENGCAWLDEAGAWRNAKDTYDNLQFGLRVGKNPQQVITTTPKPTPLIRGLVKRAGQGVVITRGKTIDNAENLAPNFLSSIVDKYRGTRIGRQELDAELLEDVPGALWNRELLEKCRCTSLPPLRRIVVAVDPAVSVSEDSDETGIVVCALGTDGFGYVLEDASGKYAPVEWARRAIGLYRKWNADRVVAEKNQGGLMVETTLRMVDKSVSYKAVHASRGKITRAEPISALFEQRRVFLASGLTELEDQLCTFAPGSSDSPDRLDAMCWGLSELMVEKTHNYDSSLAWV